MKKVSYIMFALLFITIEVKAQKLVWEENFNSTISSTTWANDLGDGCDVGICGWGNSELEYYTNRPENAYIRSDNLVIEARREAYNGKPFTSARLKTKGLMHFKYGTVEARIKIPNVTDGLWPAFWTLGSVGAGWPSIGEIDIMEIGSGAALKAGVGNKRVTSAVHWSDATGAHQYNIFSQDAPVDLSADYHIYKLVWTRQHIKMYVDGIEHYTFDISGGAAANLSEFHQPHYLLLNLAVGGSYTGKMTATDVTAPLPGKMYVDYIKLYQNAGDELYMGTDITNATAPTVAAPVPTYPAADVISLFSNTYTNKKVDTWSAGWDVADVADIQIAGNDTKLYTNLTYAGIEFTSTLIDPTTMNTFHIDIWTANSALFKVKLVDFGANGVYGGNDDAEQELTFTPDLNTWVSYDIPLSRFNNLANRSHLAQLIISGSAGSTIYMDNVFFCKKAVATVPIVAAPIPTKPASDVISLFSNAYTNVPVETWSASWDNADVADVLIGGNDTKLYTNLVFAGVEFTRNQIDATTKTHFHIDIWTENATVFKVKLVDFGTNGVYQGTPNDDTEHELTFTPSLGEWVSYDIPLSNFTGLKARAHLAQLLLVGSNSKAYIDNAYFYGKSTVPTSTATLLPTKNLSVTSNLVHDVLNISMERTLPIIINIINISGQTVYTGKIQGSQQLNLSDLTAGLYIIRTSEGDAIRFIKN